MTSRKKITKTSTHNRGTDKNNREDFARLEGLILEIGNKVDLLSSKLDTFSEKFKLADYTNNNNSSVMISEDMKKLLKDSIRRNLFVYEKYPGDFKVEKYCKELFNKTFPENQNYKEKQLWDNVWCKLRPSALDIVRWKNAEITTTVLELLEKKEPEDDRSFLENITREAFQKDKGLTKGSNRAFTWAVINVFLGLQNHTLSLDEKAIKPLMDSYNSENNTS
nr:15111_t:CDS:2 [Entrophospora candida]